jgi:hypothetical protein
VRSVRQGVQLNSAALGDGKVFMRCADILGVLERPTARLCSTKDAKGLIGIRMKGAAAVRWLTGAGSWQHFALVAASSLLLLVDDAVRDKTRLCVSPTLLASQRSDHRMK